MNHAKKIGSCHVGVLFPLLQMDKTPWPESQWKSMRGSRSTPWVAFRGNQSPRMTRKIKGCWEFVEPWPFWRLDKKKPSVTLFVHDRRESMGRILGCCPHPVAVTTRTGDPHPNLHSVLLLWRVSIPRSNHMCTQVSLNSHCFHMVGMVINPVVGVCIPTIRIPWRWDEHSLYSDFWPWHMYC